MSRIVCCCLALFIVAGWSVCGPAKIQAQAPEKKPAIKQPSLVELAKLYQELELPLPPKDASFSKISTMFTGNDGVGKHFSLAFYLKETESRQNDRLWIEFSEIKIRRPQSLFDFGLEESFDRVPGVEKVLSILKLGGLDCSSISFMGSSSELVFAIQCHLLGHNDLARFFYWRCQKVAFEPLDQTLVIAAWNYRVGELLDPVKDRKPIAAFLHGLYKKYAILSSQAEGAINHWKDHDILLERLDLTLQPSKAKAGSVEALIDGLVDLKNITPDFWEELDHRDGWDRKNQIELRKRKLKDPRPLEEIVLGKLGFEAIPALIDHVDDKRFTRSAVKGGGGLGGIPKRTLAYSQIETVGSRVRSILNSYFVSNNGTTNGEWNIKKVDYIKKWESIKNRKEYEYLVESFQKNQCETDFSKFVFDRFPDKSMNFYKMILENNCKNQNLEPFVYSIVDSPLPKSEKIDLLLLGARHKHFPFQIRALEGLLELDNATFTQVCLELLAKLPKEIKVEDGYIPHLEMARLTLCSEDSRAISFLLDFVNKLPLAEKIVFLKETFNNKYNPSLNNSIYFVGKFLGDVAVYQESGKDRELHSKILWNFEKIELRNWAAARILELLEIELPLNDKTSPEEWERIRDFVKKEIERRQELEKVK